MSTKSQAGIEDLYHVPENAKAEIVNGEVVIMAPTGHLPGRAAGKIFASLLHHEHTNETAGRAYPDGVGFLVDLQHRKSFSPDAAFYVGPATGGDFLDGAPLFAVEVRSKGDYGPAAERLLAGKRADYFVAGSLVVWDVDVLKDEVVRVYRSTSPDTPKIYRRDETAEAEPAVPGWSMPVGDLFA